MAEDGDENKSSAGGMFAPWSAIFSNSKMNEVSSTCFSIGALCLLFVLVYTVIVGFSKVYILTTGDVRFTFFFGVSTLIYAAGWTSVKAYFIRPSS